MLECVCTRRFALASLAGAIAAPTLPAAAASEDHREFVAAAFRMRDEAVRAGDQPYGAVVVKDGRIVGVGPSRVVQRNDWTAHAEREAIRDAQRRLATLDLAGALIYSTSRPCATCESVAAETGIARMLHGPGPTDAGAPQGRIIGPTR